MIRDRLNLSIFGVVHHSKVCPRYLSHCVPTPISAVYSTESDSATILTIDYILHQNCHETQLVLNTLIIIPPDEMISLLHLFS